MGKDENTTQGGGLSRRQFARAAALTSAGALMLPCDLLAQSQKPAPEAAQAQQPKLAELPPASQAEADMAYDGILRKWGSRFSNAEKADLRRLVYQQQKGLDVCRAFALAEPKDAAHLAM